MDELLGRMEKRRSKLADKVTRQAQAEDVAKETTASSEPIR
jgi:hypothetical protein